MITIHSTDILQSKTSKGFLKFWQGHIGRGYGDNIYTFTTYWQETTNGTSVVTTSASTLIKGKNIGKSNETTPEQQAHLELESEYKKKIDKGYHLEGEESAILLLPMLCLKLNDAKHRLKGRLAVQPKLDGTRQLWNSSTEIMWSRSGKAQIPAVYAHCKFDTQGYIVDGELLLPKPDYTFEETMSATTQYQPGISDKLAYYIFDIADPTGTLTFEERYAIACRLVKESNNPNVFIVPTYIIKGIEDIMEWQDKFVDMGYEGIIVRMVDGKYKPGPSKSHEIQKFKYFIDKEYKVIAVEGGSGKNEKLAAFICVDNKSGETFRVEFNGTDEKRTYMFNHPEEFIGRMLNVKFQEYNASGVPRFGKGTWFRDYDLQGGGEDEE